MTEQELVVINDGSPVLLNRASPPGYGGKWVQNSAGNPVICTIGFTVRNPVATGTSSYRSVTGTLLDNQQILFDTYCYVGWGMKSSVNADSKCGDLVALDVDVTGFGKNGHPNFQLREHKCLNTTGFIGDSGGPIYQEVGSGAKAVGTISFRFWSSGCYSTIQNVLGELGSGWLVALA